MERRMERSSHWKYLSAYEKPLLTKRWERRMDEATPIRALVVDDEPLARRRVREMLQGDADVEVVGESANGPEAVQAVREGNPDLMLLDVQMPGMDGFEVLHVLRDGPLPVIVFITAFDQYALRAVEGCEVEYI